MVRCMYISITFRWSQYAINSYKEQHKIALNPYSYNNEEQKSKKMTEMVLRGLTESFFDGHKSLKRGKAKGIEPILSWGYNVELPDLTYASISASPREEWNQDVVLQAKEFIKALIAEKSVVRKSILITSNKDLLSEQSLESYLEDVTKEDDKIHEKYSYTINYQIL